MRRPQLWLALCALALIAAACSDPSGDDEWGAASEAFFAEWSDAWAGSDSYDIVRFYGADVAVGLAQDYRTLSLNAGNRATAVSGEGRAWLVKWIEDQWEAKERSLEGVFVGADGAAAVAVIDEINAAVSVTMGMDGELITGYTDLRWRDAHLEGGRPDVRFDWLDDLVDAHVEEWGDGSSETDTDLYAPGATVEWFPAASEPATAATSRLTELEVATVVTGDRSGRAIFVGPDIAAYVLEASQGSCRGEYMVLLLLDSDRSIVTEQRLPTPHTMRRCAGEESLPTGWWNDIPVPLPVGEQVTGVIPERDGTEITIFNGSAELERLLIWGLERFESAGLVRPQLLSASFAPLPSCRSAPGVVSDSGDGGSNLVLCTDAYRACEPDRESCTTFATGDRLGMLHELGHAWLLVNLTPEDEAAFLAVRGLEHWSNASVSWHERGSEQAAEILAWGLMDEDIELVRIGNPACSDAAAAYEVLTGSPPLRSCG